MQRVQKVAADDTRHSGQSACLECIGPVAEFNCGSVDQRGSYERKIIISGDFDDQEKMIDYLSVPLITHVQANLAVPGEGRYLENCPSNFPSNSHLKND